MLVDAVLDQQQGLTETLWTDAPDAPARLQRMRACADLDECSANALAGFIERGFVVLRGVLPRATLDAAWHDLDQSQALGHPLTCHREGTGTFLSTQAQALGVPPGRYAVHDLHERSAACLEVVGHPGFTRLLRCLFDGAPVLMQSQMFRFGSDKGTHTDFTHCPVARPLQTATVWIAAEAVDATNGPLYVLPGSHRLPLHRFDNGSALWPHAEDCHQLDRYHRALHAQCLAAGLQPWCFEATPGDVLVMHPRLAHGALKPTVAGRTRRSLALHVAATQAYKGDHRCAPGASSLRVAGGLLYYHRHAQAAAEPIGCALPSENQDQGGQCL